MRTEHYFQNGKSPVAVLTGADEIVVEGGAAVFKQVDEKGAVITSRPATNYERDALIAELLSSSANTTLTADKAQIAGDGIDTATITLRFPGQGQNAVAVNVNGSPQQIALSPDGGGDVYLTGALQIVSDVPGTLITVSAMGKTVNVEVV